MKTIKIFLASSNQMMQDREQFRLFISDKNSIWTKKGFFLEVVHWQNILNSMTHTSLQDRYNEALKKCDIFILLFDRKMGEYSKIEFDTAYAQFKATNKPLVYTYFKDIQLNISEIDLKELQSLKDFQQELDGLGHFYTRYKSVEDLQAQFATQLDMLLEQGFFEGKAISENRKEIKNTTAFENNSSQKDTKKMKSTDLKDLLDEGEVSKVFEILDKKKITNKFLYNRLKKEFQAGGLTGLQLMDWTDRMKTFIGDL